MFIFHLYIQIRFRTFLHISTSTSFFSLLSRRLISTDAAARGIDIKGVKCIINYDAPQYIRTYIHRQVYRLQILHLNRKCFSILSYLVDVFVFQGGKNSESWKSWCSLHLCLRSAGDKSVTNNIVFLLCKLIE